MRPLSIIFCGTPAFACPALQALHDHPAFAVMQVITQPDRPAGRGKKLIPPPVKVLAASLGIPVWQPEDISRDLGIWTKDSECDFLVVVAYGQILSKEVLTMPRIAPINVHPSLLPRWRGASPIQNALLAGDRETGVTIQRMVEKLDCGPILAQERLSIGLRETKVSLEEKLASIGAALLVRTLKSPLKEIPQNEVEATICKKLTRELGEVDSKTMKASEIDRRVCALVPWPGVRMKIASTSLKLIETALEPHSDALAVPCADGTILYVMKLQPEAKRVMKGSDFARGRRPSIRPIRSG